MGRRQGRFLGLLLLALALWEPIPADGFNFRPLGRPNVATRRRTGQPSSQPRQEIKVILAVRWSPSPLFSAVREYEVMDVEDESDEPPVVHTPGIDSPVTAGQASEETRVDWQTYFLKEDGQVDFSSRTMQALQSAQDEGRALLVKMSQTLQSFGSYAASRALADTGLVVRVSVVVASEITARITPMLLPSTRGSVSAADDDSNENGLKLTLKQKIDLAALGIIKPPGDPEFLVDSFSATGDKAALIEDMYMKGRKRLGPAVSEKLGLFRLPVKVVASLPSLPGGLITTVNKVFEFGKEASERSTSRQLLKAFNSLPVVSASVLVSRRLLAEVIKRAPPPTRPRLGSGWRSEEQPPTPQPTSIMESWAASEARRREEEEDHEVDNELGEARNLAAAYGAPPHEDEMMVGVDEMEALMRGALRGGASGTSRSSTSGGWGAAASDAAEVMQKGGGVMSAALVGEISSSTGTTQRRTQKMQRQSRASSTALAAVTASAAWSGEEGCWADDGGVVNTRSTRVRGRWREDDGRRLQVYSMSEDGVIDTQVEEAEVVGPKEEPLVALVLLKVVDILLLGLEKVALEVLPAAMVGVSVASKRVAEIVNGASGKKGWDLLSSFERPMTRSDR